jgi:hypothetical protein
MDNAFYNIGFSPVNDYKKTYQRVFYKQKKIIIKGKRFIKEDKLTKFN